MCQYCQDSSCEDNIERLKELIEEGLEINKIEDFDCLESCISFGKSLPFIHFLVVSGILVKGIHIDYCYSNSKKIKNYNDIISIFSEATNIEENAVIKLKEIEEREITSFIKIGIGITLFLVAVALLIIYIEEVIAFLKIMLILGVIIGLFIWRYSPTKRR